MELLILIILIALNGVLAMSEMAVVSSRKVRLQQWADESRAGAQAALALANEPSHFLSTIQIGITVIGITSGAFGEATLSKSLSAWLSQWGRLASYADELALAIVVAGIALASLLIGELIPKRIALMNPERIASAIAKPMRGLAAITYPLVKVLSATTESVLRLFGVRASLEPMVTEEEIKVLMAQGAEAGVFEAHERAIVSRVFQLNQSKVTTVMTPRTRIVFLDLEEPIAVNVRRITESGHSRFPVVRGTLENIEGFVQAKTMLEDALSARDPDLSSRLAMPLYVPDTLTVIEALESFKKHRQTMAFIVNEYGELEGLVTLNDLLGALVGDIATVDEGAELDVVRRADGSWLTDGSVTIERFREVLGLDESFPEEDSGTCHTIGGLAMVHLGRVPRITDKFEAHGLRFEIIDMDKNRVDKLLVATLPNASMPANQRT